VGRRSASQSGKAADGSKAVGRKEGKADEKEKSRTCNLM
jgi:hypothetical protein